MKINISFGTILILLVILKLAKVITWSWWIVLIPLWVILLMISISLFLLYCIKKRFKWKKD